MLSACVRNLLCYPRESIRILSRRPEFSRGADVARQWQASSPSQSLKSCAPASTQDDFPNPLRAYFDSIKEGAGVWKWLHYFEPYHHHLQKFVGRPVTVVEVGVYSGGSMPMWRHYFGEECQIHGVDIYEECRVYQDSHTTIHIGDQADRAFWKRFRESVPVVDVIIDDGGHQSEQQMVTLEEMLPHLRPGGVYVCEDVHEIGNRFATFAYSLADELNAFVQTSGKNLASMPTPFQAAVSSVHLYPYVVVIEKRDSRLTNLIAPKHGSQWRPFL
jgi:hypothetical protein